MATRSDRSMATSPVRGHPPPQEEQEELEGGGIVIGRATLITVGGAFAMLGVVLTTFIFLDSNFVDRDLFSVWMERFSDRFATVQENLADTKVQLQENLRETKAQILRLEDRIARAHPAVNGSVPK